MSARCTTRRRRGDAKGNNLYSLIIKNKYKKSLYGKHPVLLVFITAAKHWLGGLKFLLQHSFYRKLWCSFVTLILLVLYNVLKCTCSKSAYASHENVVDWAAVRLALSSLPVFFDHIQHGKGNSSDLHLVLWAICLQCPPFSPSQNIQLTVHSFTGDVVYAAMFSHNKLSSLFSFMS